MMPGSKASRSRSGTRSKSRSRSRSRSQSKSGSLTPSDQEASSEGQDIKLRPSGVPSKTSSMVMKVVDAINNIRDEQGTSAQAIRKYIASTTPIPASQLKIQIRKALAEGVEEGVLVRPKGSKATGSNGRFRVNNNKACRKACIPRCQPKPKTCRRRKPKCKKKKKRRCRKKRKNRCKKKKRRCRKKKKRC